MIDLSDRIIQDPTPKKPSDVRWHPWRRALQVVCGILFVILPLTNGLRADVRTGIFYFGWHQAHLGDTMLVFWIGMLALWALCAVSFLYGRLWCGWVCPQTLASDFADSVKSRLDKALRARPGRPTYILSRTIWSTLMAAISLVTGVVSACYWFAPSTVAASTLNPGVDGGAAFVVYGIAGLLAADLFWVRRKFCSHACPYGAFLGTLADKHTLAVRYLDERDDDCIRCGKCVTDCPMDIDIKKGVGQYACIGCGECVDACNEVLGKRGVPGLIEYRYGLEPENDMSRLTLLQRVGLWDGKRWGVIIALIGFTGTVAWATFGSTPMTASVAANGAVTRVGSTVSNGYTLTISNGQGSVKSVNLTLSGLPQGSIAAPADSVDIDGHADRVMPLTITAPSTSGARGAVVPVTLTATSTGERTSVQLMFLYPK